MLLCLLILVFPLLVSAASDPPCPRSTNFVTKAGCESNCPEALCRRVKSAITQATCWRCPDCEHEYNYFTNKTCNQQCYKMCRKTGECWTCDSLKFNCFRDPLLKPTKSRCEVYVNYDSFAIPPHCELTQDGCWRASVCSPSARYYEEYQCLRHCGRCTTVQGPGENRLCYDCMECSEGFSTEDQCRLSCYKADFCYFDFDHCWKCPDCYKRNQSYTQSECQADCQSPHNCSVTHETNRKCWKCLDKEPINPCGNDTYQFRDECKKECKSQQLCYLNSTDLCWHCPECDPAKKQYPTMFECLRDSRCIRPRKTELCLPKPVSQLGLNGPSCWKCQRTPPPPPETTTAIHTSKTTLTPKTQPIIITIPTSKIAAKWGMNWMNLVMIEFVTNVIILIET